MQDSWNICEHGNRFEFSRILSKQIEHVGGDCGIGGFVGGNRLLLRRTGLEYVGIPDSLTRHLRANLACATAIIFTTLIAEKEKTP